MTSRIKLDMAQVIDSVLVITIRTANIPRRGEVRGPILLQFILNMATIITQTVLRNF